MFGPAIVRSKFQYFQGILPDIGTVDEIKELFVPQEKLALTLAESKTLPYLALTELDLQWVQVLSEGWASPLNGFMTEDELLNVSVKIKITRNHWSAICLIYQYRFTGQSWAFLLQWSVFKHICLHTNAQTVDWESLVLRNPSKVIHQNSVTINLLVPFIKWLVFQVFHFNTLDSSTNQSVAIVLPVSTADKERLNGSSGVTLVYEGRPVAILRSPQFYVHRKEERACRQFGSCHPDHPHIKVVLRSHKDKFHKVRSHSVRALEFMRTELKVLWSSRTVAPLSALWAI